MHQFDSPIQKQEFPWHRNRAGQFMDTASSSSSASQAPQPSQQVQAGAALKRGSLLPPYHLTIRFSNSLPDLELDIPFPHTTPIAAVKQLLRQRLAGTPAARGRLRFIHGGKILPDEVVLSSVLKPAPSPPPDASDRKGKRVAAQPRVYVNCSIGDELSSSALAAEAAAATAAVTDAPTTNGSRAATVALRANTPRGFDRLLASGFSMAEVNQLRLQFRSRMASRHTPDTMPSPDTLRSMEDAWLDNDHGATTVGGTGDNSGGAGVDEDAMERAEVLETLIYGMMVGFMFPMGSVAWLVREEGLLPKRVKVFVMCGFVLVATLGVARALTAGR